MAILQNATSRVCFVTETCMCCPRTTYVLSRVCPRGVRAEVHPAFDFSAVIQGGCLNHVKSTIMFYEMVCQHPPLRVHLCVSTKL